MSRARASGPGVLVHSLVALPSRRPPLLAFALACVSALVLSAALLPLSVGAVVPRTTLPAIERQVMCVTCKIPLNVAESPQADRERALIRRLIAEGKTEAQVKGVLVGQYGAAVLGLPASKGFDLTAYLVPIALVLGLLALLALLLPSWRRHARARAESTPSAPKLSEAEAARLDADLKRFD
jgi:cytochrome c-type biogenesis protein CcmH